MIAVGGLGRWCAARGIDRLDMGLASIGSLEHRAAKPSCSTASPDRAPRRGSQRWWHTGPLGLLSGRLRQEVLFS